MKFQLPDAAEARALGRRFAVHLGIVTLIDIACAAVVTYLMRIGSDFTVNLVFSLCIGTTALILIDVPRMLLWGDSAPPKPLFFPLLVVAAALAYVIGTALAVWILDLPAPQVIASQANNAVGLLVLTILASLFASWFFWNRGNLQALMARAAAEKANAAAVAKQATQAQLQLLQAQIEPHMLFNTLANLQSLIAVDPARAQTMLDQLILYLRATLVSSRVETTTLAHEFSLMEAYLGLMSVRMGTRLSRTLHLPDSMRDLRIAPMLLQPLVENAVRHGLEPKIDGGHIEVAASLEDSMLRLTVTDTGLGLDAAGGGTGVGLANVRERLQALHGAMAGLTLERNLPSGAIARISIPIPS
jgi:sensor histidine kinase YesM